MLQSRPSIQLSQMCKKRQDFSVIKAENSDYVKYLLADRTGFES